MDKDSKYYWIKLKMDILDDDSPLDYLLGLPNGAEYVVLYIKLCMMTANKKGRLCSQIGEVLIPYDAEKIAKSVKYFSVDTVRVAMNLYAQLGLIYTESDGILAIANFDEIVGSETAWAVKKREYREKLKMENAGKIEDKSEDIDEDISRTMSDKRLEIRDKSIDIITSRYKKERGIERKSEPSCEEVVDLFHQLAPSYPQIKVISEIRKKAIKARLNTYTLDDFRELFTKAEASRFLKGGNDRNWSATFDWLIKDSNMAKVLEGNYDNKNDGGNDDGNKPKIYGTYV